MNILRGGIEVPRNIQLEKLLTFPNPFEPAEVFEGFITTKSRMVVPRNIRNIKDDCSVDVVDSPISIELSNGFTLRSYQQKPVAAIINALTGIHGECLLTAKTGSGKSFSLSAVIKEVGQRTLILVHLSMLATQMFEELSANSSADIKILEKDNTELGDINIATFQYLHNNPELVIEIAKHIGLVVVDEAENMLSTTRMAVFYQFNPKYQLLMTATPSRELVGRTPMIHHLVGKNIVVMEPDTQIEPQHVMLDYRTLNFQSPGNKLMYKGALTRFIMKSTIPVDLIDFCKLLLEFEGCVWIIVDSLKLQDHIMELLKNSNINSEVIRGNTSKKERKRILDEVSDKTCRILLGSAPLSAGISMPELSFAFRLMPNSSSQELLIQQEGRLKRFAEFKLTQNTLWVDYAIEGSLAYNGKKRFAYYKSLGRFTFGKLSEIKAKINKLLIKENI